MGAELSCVGPRKPQKVMGTRIEPLGKTSFEEARAAFRDQIAALVEGGVDLLILETFGYLEEIHQAIGSTDLDLRFVVARSQNQRIQAAQRSDFGDLFHGFHADVGAGVLEQLLQPGKGRGTALADLPNIFGAYILGGHDGNAKKK